VAPVTLRIAVGTPGEDDPVVSVTRTPSGAAVFIDGVPHEAQWRTAGRAFELSLEERTERVWIATEGDVVYVHAFGQAHRLEVVDPAERSARKSDQTDTVTAPTPGTVVALGVQAGGEVVEGDVLMVIESMKMHSEIIAWRDGEVERTHQRLGDTFESGAPLVSLVPRLDPDQEDQQ
jgi:biotin carboxyl carrier protein